MSNSARNLRWAYMDHWRIDSPQGYVSQYSSIPRFDGFLKQVASLGFKAIETFDFHLPVLIDLFGSLLNAMNELGYRGWVIVESDKGPAPVASSIMLNSWYLQARAESSAARGVMPAHV